MSDDEKTAFLDPRIEDLINMVKALDAKLDARLQDTRPIWEAVQTHLTEIRTDIHKLDRNFDILNRELLEVKTEQADQAERLDKLERKPY